MVELGVHVVRRYTEGDGDEDPAVLHRQRPRLPLVHLRVGVASDEIEHLGELGLSEKWAWSWPVWISVNLMQAVYFWHLRLFGQFALQFVLMTMSVYGWNRWRHDAAAPQPEPALADA